MKNFVSIITVNFNGKKYLKDFLESALAQNYPKEEYEVLVVDNGSTDDSNEYIEKNFPKVKVVLSKKNLGFGAGNNLGMKNASGDLFFLVNNDTVLGKNSLKNIVDSFSKWSKKEKIGAVNAKLVLIDAYVPLVIEEAFYSGFKISKEARSFNNEPFVIPHEGKDLFTEKVFLPLKYAYVDRLKINFKIKPYRKSGFRIRLEDKPIYQGFFKTLSKEQELNLELSTSDVGKYKVDLIQNAGNFYFRDGYGRDRGAVVIKHKQYYESDTGQYDKEEFVPGFCGAGVLLNKKALEKVGYFDEDFFMYYEDGDLSLRLRENGWKTLYAPGAKIRHIHAGSSKEWSEFFVYNVERGRLLFMTKHWPRFLVLREWIKYLFKDTLGVPLYYLSRGEKRVALARLTIRLKVGFSLFPELILGLLRFKRLNYREVREFL